MAGLTYFLEEVFNEGKQADEYRKRKAAEAKATDKKKKIDLLENLTLYDIRLLMMRKWVAM